MKFWDYRNFRPKHFFSVGCLLLISLLYVDTFCEIMCSTISTIIPYRSIIYLQEFGYPDAPVDKVLDSVIKRCGHKPASDEDFDYIGRMRENAKLLFTVVIDDEAVKELLNNQTVDEVILHVLRLAKKQNAS